MQLTIPDFGLVVMIGAGGAGKSTLARRLFRDTEILASDHYRRIVGDDERSGRTTKDAFDVIRTIAGKRLAARRVAVIDATNVGREDREGFASLAREHDAPLTAVILDMPERTCQRQNAARASSGETPRPAHVVTRQWKSLRRSTRTLNDQGFRRRYRLTTPEQAGAATLVREPLHCDQRTRGGPFDIIGDVHGCLSELERLLGELGYRVVRRGERPEDGYDVAAPAGRTAILVGDLANRGPASAGTLALAMAMVESGAALAVPGNHEAKLQRALSGERPATPESPTAETMAAIARAPEGFGDKVAEFLKRLPTHCWLDGGRLVVAHAGLPDELQGRTSARVRSFALYGDTTGEKDDDGHPVRRDWARGYRGRAAVVYGHTARRDAEWVNNTICIDTGCVFGGRLTALRYPERGLVSVDAERTWDEDVPRAMLEQASGPSAQQASDELLDVEDLAGRVRIETKLAGTVTIRPENGAAALELLSRFTIDPHWLIYAPPTMAPCEAATDDEMLERPAEAFEHFRRAGARQVICEEKHMGSRAIIVVARNADAGERRFGTRREAGGVIYTRTGRRFFDEEEVEAEVLGRIRDAMTAASFWKRHETEWACLDSEVMPWSAKGGELIERQYAPAGAAARAGLEQAREVLTRANERDRAHEPLLRAIEARAMRAQLYIAAYERYNWRVEGTDDLKIAPFHILATEGQVHTARRHEWHLEESDALCREEAILTRTARLTVNLDEAADVARATAWWEAQTEAGGEGMVVKPMVLATRGERGTMTPALKCRGREYLRIIYGADYTAEDVLERLRKRSTRGKRALALREFALGIEGLEQFVARGPLRQVHKAVFGVLALESEPMDPRL